MIGNSAGSTNCRSSISARASAEVRFFLPDESARNTFVKMEYTGIPFCEPGFRLFFVFGFCVVFDVMYANSLQVTARLLVR